MPLSADRIEESPEYTRDIKNPLAIGDVIAVVYTPTQAQAHGRQVRVGEITRREPLTTRKEWESLEVTEADSPTSRNTTFTIAEEYGEEKPVIQSGTHSQVVGRDVEIFLEVISWDAPHE